MVNIDNLNKANSEINICIGMLTIPAMTSGDKEIKEVHSKLISIGALLDDFINEELDV